LTARKLITTIEMFKNKTGLYEKTIDFIKLIILLSQQDIPKLLQPIDKQLMEIGWPPSMRLTPQEAIRLTVGDPPMTKTQIEKYLLRKFKREMLSGMIENWAKTILFAERIHILKDAISAHNTGMYTLSVPVLLAQSEGIIACLADIKGRKSHRDIVNIAKQMSKDVVLNESFMHVLSNAFSEDFEFGQAEIFNLGRNSILHGINLKYATPENSLKSILLIDFLFEISKSVHKNNAEDN